jgi:hypothetical protein
MTLLPRLKAGFYLVVAGLVSGHPRPACRCGATAFQHLPLPFLRTKEAVLFIGVSYGTLEKHHIYGTGPNDRGIGRRIIYVVANLREWAERAARRATSDPGGTTILPAEMERHGQPDGADPRQRNRRRPRCCRRARNTWHARGRTPRRGVAAPPHCVHSGADRCRVAPAPERRTRRPPAGCAHHQITHRGRQSGHGSDHR